MEHISFTHIHTRLLYIYMKEDDKHEIKAKIQSQSPSFVKSIEITPLLQKSRNTNWCTFKHLHAFATKAFDVNVNVVHYSHR